MIRSHLLTVESALSSYLWVEKVEVVTCRFLETLEETILIYRFRVNLKNGDFLEMMERVVSRHEENDFETTTYSFHLQNKKGKIIRRRDNALHFPDLPGCPHHIHDGSEKNVIPGKPVTAIEILDEINRIIS